MKICNSGAATTSQNTAYIIPASAGQGPGGGQEGKAHFKNPEILMFSSRGECGEKQQGRVVTMAIFG